MAGGQNTTNFNELTAPNANDIYIVMQTGEGGVEPYKLNIDPKSASDFKSSPILSGNALSPEKLCIKGIDPEATYFSQPDFMEALRFDYNVAMTMAVDSYNALSEEIGLDTKIPEPTSLGDLADDHNDIQNWLTLDRQLDHAIKAADGMGIPQELIDAAVSARSVLQSSGAMAQETYDVYFDNSKPYSPDVTNPPINFDEFKDDAGGEPSACSGYGYGLK